MSSPQYPLGKFEKQYFRYDQSVFWDILKDAGGNKNNLLNDTEVSFIVSTVNSEPGFSNRRRENGVFGTSIHTNRHDGGPYLGYGRVSAPGTTIRNGGTDHGLGDAYYTSSADKYTNINQGIFKLKKTPKTDAVQIFPKNGGGEILSFTTKSYNEDWDYFNHRLIGVPSTHSSNYTNFDIGVMEPYTNSQGSVMNKAVSDGILVQLKNRRHNWYVVTDRTTLGAVTVSGGALSAESKGWYMTILNPGPALKAAYYERTLNNFSNIVKQNPNLTTPGGDNWHLPTKEWGAPMNCCTEQYTNTNDYINSNTQGSELGYGQWIIDMNNERYNLKGVPISRSMCANNYFTPGSTACNNTISQFCKLVPDDPICGCSNIPEKYPSLDTRITNFPQCFMTDCINVNAYKNSEQGNVSTNCPPIKICKQNINVLDAASIEWSAINQDCSSNDPPVMGPTNPPDLDRPAPDPSHPDPSNKDPNEDKNKYPTEDKNKDKEDDKEDDKNKDIIKKDPTSLNILPLALLGGLLFISIGSTFLEQYLISGVGVIGLVILGVLIILKKVPMYTEKYTEKYTSNKFIVYGTNWCGYTTKQKNHLKNNYGKSSYKYVDCDKPKNKKLCKKFSGFPVTKTPNGKLVHGFNKNI